MTNPDEASIPAERSRFAWLHPKLYLGAFGISGALFAAAAIWLFFWIADEVFERSALVSIDTAVANWLQVHGTEWGESIFVGVSYLGAQLLIAGLVIGAVTLLIRRQWRHLAVLAITCGGGAALNAVLKASFHRTRPEFASEFNPSSSSFPSGHAMDSLIVYGLAAYWLSRRYPQARHWIVAGAAALVGLIGFARIYLGVHYLSDVIAGFIGGGVWLFVCITGYRFAERRRVGPAGPGELQ